MMEKHLQRHTLRMSFHCKASIQEKRTPAAGERYGTGTACLPVLTICPGA